jgi:cytochrome c biogenesis protein CcmG, thiol:disulfide interchange protein DsbE
MTAKNESRRLQILPMLVFVAVAGLFAVALRTGDPSKLPSALIGKPVPPSSFAALAGLVADSKSVPGFTNADLSKGKPSIVNFWASWCGPCVDEHPLLAELKIKSGLEIFGVNYKDDPAAARRFLGRYGNPFAAVGTDADGSTAIDWGVYGMPETFVVNGRGEIVYKHVGPLSAEAIEAKILPVIKANQ